MIGAPELVVLLLVSSVWLVPLAVLVWLVVEVRRLRQRVAELESAPGTAPPTTPPATPPPPAT